jgi:hemoglobin
MTDEKTPYDRLGGADGVRRLVDRFYDLMDTLPEATQIRAMHAKSLDSSRNKLWMFLSGYLGGPQLYIEKHGHPRMRRRHMPFPIDEAARDAWLQCMNQALEEQVSDTLLRTQLAYSFARVADHMRNQPEK